MMSKTDGGGRRQRDGKPRKRAHQVKAVCTSSLYLRHALPFEKVAAGDEAPHQRSYDGVGHEQRLMRQEHQVEEGLLVCSPEVSCSLEEINPPEADRGERE